jgi:putative ABC transport system permease protein
MNGLAWLLSQTGSVSLLMAIRHIARTPGSYSTPLTLLILTLSLSIFTASMAGSLDNHLYDQTYYKSGADVVFLERGENSSLISAFAQSTASSEADEEAGSAWVFLPVSDYLDQPGVQAVTRVGTYPAVASIGTRQSVGTFYGIDRLTFGEVSYWRTDFASDSLGALMNQLAVYPDGVLVPASFLRQYGLSAGDLLTLNVDTYGDSHDLDYRIVGSFDLFPGWYPEDNVLMVGNLDYLFEQAGGEYPYRVWINTQSGTDPVGLSDTLAPLSIARTIPALDIAEAQASPRRQGMFGILSVGYSAAVVLTVIGFLMYALFSFRQRFVELGMMRAIGLSTRQMTALLAWELALLIIIGSAVGTALGIQISILFVPFMKVSGADILNIPPYQVQVAWSAIIRIYGVFTALFAVELALLVVLLRRMKISQAIKLGETV